MLSKEKLKLILTGAVFFILGILAVNLINNTKTPTQDKLGLKTQPTPTPKFCGDERYQETAPQSEKEISKIVFGDKSAVELAKDECMWVFGAVKGKLTGTDEENIVMRGASVGCGSCHSQVVYVLSKGKVVFEKWFGDPKVEIDKDKDGKDVLAITAPVRVDIEPLCCPSMGITTLYRWSKKTNTFFSIESRPYKYEYEQGRDDIILMKLE